MAEDESFVRLDDLMTIGVGLGTLPLDPDRFAALFEGLADLVGTAVEMQELRDAAQAFVRQGNPAPMRTLAWRPRRGRPKPGKPKPKPKPKPRHPKHPMVRVKLKDTHTAWMSCTYAAALRARAASSKTPRFTVSSVTPIDACPGWPLTIHGTNFGAVGGTVAFRAAAGSGSDYLAASADSWSDGTIVVTVPTWAREGRLRVNPIDHVFIACHRKFTVYRLPNPYAVQNDDFKGGLPDVFALTVDGRDAQAWAAPDKDATVAWVTTSGTVTIAIRNESDPTQAPWKKESLVGGTGTATWHPQPATGPTKFVVALTVTNHCDSVTRELPVMVTVPAVLKIEGVEVTQGIQTFSLTGGPRNTIPTVEGKDTIVRLYASADRTGWFDNLLAGFSAALTIGGVTWQPINQAPAGSMTGGNPYRNLGGLSTIDRESADASFNFRIPAALCAGTKTFQVSVFGIDEFGFASQSQFVTWTWHKKKALAIRYVRVAYQGTIPTDAEASWTVQRAFDLLPSPAWDIGPAWLAQWSTGQDLATKDGKQALLEHLSDQHNCTFSEWAFPWEDDCPDDDGAWWIGVVAKSVGGRARTGGNSGWSAWFKDDRTGCAHEIGHLLCLCHVNQGCNGTNPDVSNTCDGSDKRYDSLPSGGQVLDVAFDPYANQTVPAPRFDFMSYACAKWISEFNWNRVFSGL
jgi:hypothetical protein